MWLRLSGLVPHKVCCASAMRRHTPFFGVSYSVRCHHDHYSNSHSAAMVAAQKGIGANGSAGLLLDHVVALATLPVNQPRAQCCTACSS